MPLHNGEQHNRNQQQNASDEKNNFIKICNWLIQQAWDNQETLMQLFFLFILMSMGQMIFKPVQAAKTERPRDDRPIEEYKEPYCQKDAHGDDFCYVRIARVYPPRNGRQEIEYRYDEGINNIGDPNFIRDPRFDGRPAVYQQNPNNPIDHVHNPHAMFAHRGLRDNHPNNNFDPLNPNINAPLAGNPNADNFPLGNLNPVDPLRRDPFPQHPRDLNQGNNNFRRRPH